MAREGSSPFSSRGVLVFLQAGHHPLASVPDQHPMHDIQKALLLHSTSEGQGNERLQVSANDGRASVLCCCHLTPDAMEIIVSVQRRGCHL